MVVTEKFYVGYSDINKEQRLSNIAILQMFQDIACMHSSLVGDGLKQSDAGWFLTAYHVKIHKRPDYEERVTVNTWNRSMKGITACREFEMYNEAGELAVTGISNWARVNAATQQLERINPELGEVYGSEPDRTNFGSAWIAKLRECESYTYERDFFVDRNVIDTNEHMNNVYYMDMAELALPEEVYRRAESLEFEITYRKAIKYGETIRCLFGETDDAYIVTAKSEDLSEVRAVIKLYK